MGERGSGASHLWLRWREQGGGLAFPPLALESLKVHYCTREPRVADLHHFNADPDPALYFNADPDPAFHLNADLDPDPAPHQSDRNLRFTGL